MHLPLDGPLWKKFCFWNMWKKLISYSRNIISYALANILSAGSLKLDYQVTILKYRTGYRDHLLKTSQFLWEITGCKESKEFVLGYYWPKCLGPCNSCGRTGWRPSYLASAWPSCRYCVHLGSKIINAWIWIFLSVFCSCPITLPLKWVDQ